VTETTERDGSRRGGEGSKGIRKWTTKLNGASLSTTKQKRAGSRKSGKGSEFVEQKDLIVKTERLCIRNDGAEDREGGRKKRGMKRQFKDEENAHCYKKGNGHGCNKLIRSASEASEKKERPQDTEGREKRDSKKPKETMPRSRGKTTQLAGTFQTRSRAFQGGTR